MTTFKREPYPLQWPEDWKRTEAWRRSRPKFQAMFARDRDAVLKQLAKRNAKQIVITSDLPTRNDGIPYANASCQDPGIAVWWVEKGREMVMACDRWNHVVFNMRAIDMTLDALRGIDRWGASTMVERAFAGFAALPAGGGAGAAPPPTPEVPRRTWRRQFEVGSVEYASLPNEDLLAIVRARYRHQMKAHHPDVGGDPNLAAEITAAFAVAEKELAGA